MEPPTLKSIVDRKIIKGIRRKKHVKNIKERLDKLSSTISISRRIKQSIYLFDYLLLCRGEWDWKQHLTFTSAVNNKLQEFNTYFNTSWYLLQFGFKCDWCNVDVKKGKCKNKSEGSGVCRFHRNRELELHDIIKTTPLIAPLHNIVWSYVYSSYIKKPSPNDSQFNR